MATDNIARAMAARAGKSANRSASVDAIANAIIASGKSVTAYNAAMQMWFKHKLPTEWTPLQLTALCDEWYTITRTGWAGYSKFYQPNVTAVSDGEKCGDNAGLVCIPSTDTEANRDDYAGLPMFAVCDCNWVVDSDTLEPVVTDIDGITDGFERNNPERFVGVLQMAPWHFWQDDDSTYLHGVADHRVNEYEHVEPVPEAIRIDGTMRPWVLHGKYMSCTVDGRMTNCAGKIPTGFMSHNSLHGLSSKNGSQYSGGTTADDGWMKLMNFVKYANITADGIRQGCCNYNYQYPAAVSEAGVTRVLLTNAQASNLVVGSSVIIGSYNGSLDRSSASVYSITGPGGAVITRIERVVVNETQYSAVYIDVSNVFDTIANGASKTGTTYISTWFWRSGSCDAVRGSDGSLGDNISGNYPAKLQGIEYSVGGYEVYADVVQKMVNDAYTPWIVRRSKQQASSITANYIDAGIDYKQPASDGWTYPKKMEYKNGVFYPCESGGSSSTYLRDGFYANKAGTAGTREWLAFGRLTVGSASGGLSCLNGPYALSFGWWGSLARLSPNGNRGEFSGV